MSHPRPALSDEAFASVVDAARRKGVFVADPTPPAQQTSVVNGLRLNFLDWHGDSRPPMLLLHGALLQAHVWDFFSLDMRQHFHIRALDLPGHGDSDWAVDGDYSRARVAAATVALIEELNLTSLVLVGHSFGGAVGALVAAELTHRVAALVMIDSTLMRTGGQSIRARVAALPQTFESFEQFSEHAARLSRRPDPARLSNSLRWNARQMEDGRWTWKYDPALRHAALGPGDFEDVWSALHTFAGRVLFVRASNHSHLTDEAAERLRSFANLQLVVVPEAGHNVMTDNPLVFRRVVGDYLSMHNPYLSL